jgi:hypothetical protein
MKRISLILLACVSVAGQLHAQTPAPAAPPAGSVTRACKEQVKSLCGHAHGDEMKSCIKSNLDMKKFSADCAAELANQTPKPSS